MKTIIAIMIVVMFGTLFAYYTNVQRRKDLTDYYQSLKDRAPAMAWVFMCIDWLFNLDENEDDNT